jgi:hypothetical protein
MPAKGLHRRMLNAERPSRDAGSVNIRKKLGRRDGLPWILAYWTIGPTISESSILGNLDGCWGSFNDGILGKGAVSAKVWYTGLRADPPACTLASSWFARHIESISAHLHSASLNVRDVGP